MSRTHAFFNNNMFDTNQESSAFDVPQRDSATNHPILYVCHGPQCGRSAKYIMDRLSQVQSKGFKCTSEKRGCLGLCPKGPNIQLLGKVHHGMNPLKAAELAKKTT